jgi:hypothetical protein
MKHTAGTAAKAVGKTKSTITKAIASGKLSAIKNDNGAWEIDVAELHRVYPPALTETVSQQANSTPNRNGGNTIENQGLERLVKLLEEQVEDLKQDRDQWRVQATMLLSGPPREPQTDTAPEPQKDPPPEPRKRIFGIF